MLVVGLDRGCRWSTALGLSYARSVLVELTSLKGPVWIESQSTLWFEEREGSLIHPQLTKQPSEGFQKLRRIDAGCQESCVPKTSPIGVNQVSIRKEKIQLNTPNIQCQMNHTFRHGSSNVQARLASHFWVSASCLSDCGRRFAVTQA